MYSEIIKDMLAVGLLVLRSFKGTDKLSLNPHWSKYIDDPIRGPVIQQYLHATDFLPSDTSSSERMFHLLNGTNIRPVCNGCNMPTKFVAATQTYQQYCSSCVKNNDSVKKQIAAKRTATNIERYGYTNSSMNTEVKEKREATNIERYGVAYPLQNVAVQHKTHATQNEIYGGVGFQVPTIRETSDNKKTDLYGTKCPANNIDIRQSIIESHIRTHGVHNSAQIGKLDAITLLQDKNWLTEQHYTKCITLAEIADGLNVNQSTVQNYLHAHGLEPKRFAVSAPERKLVEFITSLNITNIKTSDRNVIGPKELDIVLPDQKVAIEYHGLHWHNDDMPRITPNYHLEKTLACNKAGYRLIHIFENEWIHNQDLVKSRLATILGHVERRIYARKCTVVPIDPKLKRDFMIYNHIQGDCSSSHNYGLYYKNTLVAVMTFGKSRYTKRCEYELMRFATARNTVVVGGGSKLFARFVKDLDPTSVVSYSDLRWNTGNVYTKLGFVLSHVSKPNYFYFKNDTKLYHRSNFQKHKLSGMLEVFDSSLSEVENMKINGYKRIWDCGNAVYTWSNDKIQTAFDEAEG